MTQTAPAAEPHTCDLWGCAGELWTPQGRLPDFSHAGYHAGERTIPNVAVKASVKDFGAVGDGKADDTRAFRGAIAKVRGGAIDIPAGRYKITNILEIKKSNLVLRGAGPDKTVLYMARSFKEIKGEVPYSDGLIRVLGERGGKRLAAVAEVAQRGDYRLTLNAAAPVRPGQTVRLKMANPADNSLGRHLYGGLGALNAERQKWYGGQIVDWAVRVKSVDGRTIELDRPLRTDVRPGWKPEIWSYEPTVQEVGIEGLTLEFPPVQYGGHHKEAGYYGILLRGVFNCWVRNVTMIDTDIGVFHNGCGWNTVSGVTLKAGVRTEASDSVDHATGHYGFSFSGCGTQDNLVTDCQLQTTFVHNIAVASFANGNVYSGLTTTGGRFDHHAGAPYENLYTDIQIRGKASDLFMCGGNRADEPNAGARTTFWNVRVPGRSFPGRIPALKDGTPRWPLINIVGVDMVSTTHTKDGPWIDRWPGEATGPPNLYQAQLARRLKVALMQAEIPFPAHRTLTGEDNDRE